MYKYGKSEICHRGFYGALRRKALHVNIPVFASLQTRHTFYPDSNTTKQNNKLTWSCQNSILFSKRQTFGRLDLQTSVTTLISCYDKTDLHKIGLILFKTVLCDFFPPQLAADCVLLVKWLFPSPETIG